MKRKLLFFLSLLGVLMNLYGEDKELRIISLDNSASEILYELGVGEQIVGRLKHISYPEKVLSAKVVGDHGSFDVEGLLSLKPTHVIFSGDFNKEKMEPLKNMKAIEIIVMPSEKNLEVIVKKVKMLSESFAKKEEGLVLIAKLKAQIQEINQKLQSIDKEKAPKSLCLYLRGTETMFILGSENGACGLIDSLGAPLCFPELKNPVPLNDESIVKANPDLFIVYISGLESVGGLDAFLKMKSIQLTKAASEKRVIAVNGTLLSGFGPRVPEAALRLLDAIHHQKGYVEIK